MKTGRIQGKPVCEYRLSLSRASNPLEEGATTTGGVGILNNQREHPGPEKEYDIV